MEELLKIAIRLTNKPAEAPDNANKHSVVLKMHPPATENFPLVESHILPLMPGAEFYSVGDSIYLIGLYPELSDAERINTLVNASLDKYNDLVMEELDVDDDWMETYLSAKSLGIEIVMRDGWITSKSGLDKYFEKEIQRNKETARYRESLKLSKGASLDYTHDDIAGDVLSYAEQVFDADSYDKDRLAQAVRESLSEIDIALAGQSMLPRHACQQTIFAVKDKLALLSEELPEPDRIQAAQAYGAIYEAMDQATGGIKHDDWISFSRIFASHLLAAAPTLKFKPAAVSADKYVDYGFLPFSRGSVERDMNARLAPSNIKYSIDEQGSSLARDLSGGLAAYYLYILSAKHEMAFDKALHEYSRDVRVLTFPEDLADMVQRTSPVPANPKKASQKLKG